MLQRTMFVMLMAAALSVPVLAQPAPSDDERGPQDRHQGRAGKMQCCDKEQMPRHAGREMMEELKLTDAQKGQMEKLRTELEKKQVAVQGRIAVLRVELKELFQAENPDRGAIEKKMKEVSDLQHQLKVNGLDHLFAVKGILTADQQKLWKQHMLKMGEERFGLGMGPEGKMMKRGRR
jgi:Spy/CpxP family protein refolding chaperone